MKKVSGDNRGKANSAYFRCRESEGKYELWEEKKREKMNLKLRKISCVDF